MISKPELSLQSKVALITGAAGGIGKAIVEAFVSAGARLFITDLRESALQEMCRDLKKRGVECGYITADLTVAGSASQLVDRAVEVMGQIDVLVNCAGINRPQKALDISEQNWNDIFDINLKALFFLCQSVGKEMIKKGGGKIINISSQASLVAVKDVGVYCASKGGVNQITRSLALEWAEHHITVNAVAPTFVLTDISRERLENPTFRSFVMDNIPLRRLAQPADVAYPVLFLASDFANMITGHVLSIDGGWTIK